MRQALVTFFGPLLCSYFAPSVAKQNFGALVRAKLDVRSISGVIPVGRREFAGHAFAGAGAITALPLPSSSSPAQEIEWIVLFFHMGDDIGSTPSTDVRSRVQQLNSMWDDLSDMKQVRFAEVRCDSDPQLCVEQGLDVSISRPAVRRYDTKGLPVSTWQPDASVSILAGNGQLAAGQFSAWMHMEFGTIDPAGRVMALVARFEVLRHNLFAMSVEDLKIATTGFALIIGQIFVVAWVIVTGFELMPDRDASRLVASVVMADR